MASMKKIETAINKAAKKLSNDTGWDERDCRTLISDTVLGLIPKSLEIYKDKDIISACEDGICEVKLNEEEE